MTKSESIIIAFLGLAIIFTGLELNNALQVNTRLKDAVENRNRQFSSLQVIDSYPSQNTLTVVDGKGYQSTADQYHAQKALNHANGKLIQATKKNRFSGVQWPRNNYQQPVQKTAQSYQYQLGDIELHTVVTGQF